MEVAAHQAVDVVAPPEAALSDEDEIVERLPVEAVTHDGHAVNSSGRDVIDAVGRELATCLAGHTFDGTWRLSPLRRRVQETARFRLVSVGRDMSEGLSPGRGRNGHVRSVPALTGRGRG